MMRIYSNLCRASAIPARFCVRLTWRTAGDAPSPTSARNAARWPAAAARRARVASPLPPTPPPRPLGLGPAAAPRVPHARRGAAGHDGGLHLARIGTAAAVEIDFDPARHHHTPLAGQNVPRTEKEKIGPISRSRSSTKLTGLSPRTPV